MTILEDPPKPSQHKPSKGIEINVNLKLSEEVVQGIKQGLKGTARTLVHVLMSSLMSWISLNGTVPGHIPQPPTIDVQPPQEIHLDEVRS